MDALYTDVKIISDYQILKYCYFSRKEHSRRTIKLEKCIKEFCNENAFY